MTYQTDLLEPTLTTPFVLLVVGILVVLTFISIRLRSVLSLFMTANSAIIFLMTILFNTSIIYFYISVIFAFGVVVLSSIVWVSQN